MPSIEREACPLNLAPTTSVLVAMALGDALAMTLQKRRGFSEEDYALNHPGGRLGRRLTLRVRDVMPGGGPRSAARSTGRPLYGCRLRDQRQARRRDLRHRHGW